MTTQSNLSSHREDILSDATLRFLARAVDRSIYPMPSFVQITARDIRLSSQWYRDVLGFASILELPRPDGSLMMDHLRFAKYADVMLVATRPGTSEPTAGSGLTMYFTVERGSLDILAEVVHARSPESRIAGPVLQPWNARELILKDPDGHRIVFAEQGDTSRSFEDVMANVASEAATANRGS